MIIGVPRETYPGENRVALIPATLPALKKLGLDAIVEAGAGTPAGHVDAEYEAQGAQIVSRKDVFARADIVAQVRTLGANQTEGRADLSEMRKGQYVLGHADPLGAPEAAADIAATGASLFALELIPRITRAQSMDVLSSMATIAGYKAVLLAATHLPRMFPLLMTAAGTLQAARVFVIGAGVAGLQAIGVARKLGAVVEAYDVRSAVKEQIQSLGAKFVEMEIEAGAAEDKGGYAKELGEDFYRKQRELMMKVVSHSDVVVTTAAIPGKKSPVLVTAEMVRAMHPGSVIVDLAAERGGNCELTKADETVVENGVTILGPTNLPATVPVHASQMYSNNVLKFLQGMVKEGQLNLNLEDEVVRETLVTRDGEVVHERIRGLLGVPAGRGEGGA
ncbi:MAG: Re/Si-specific NAD(P)(+) transhydrogenase subunit alpha [Gemmatimonadetes bacterium]|nr:Re/Si-specific NAD(P)(+) transhydrogenase subunit alpha [Gemmatimonadota bacterium]